MPVSLSDPRLLEVLPLAALRLKQRRGIDVDQRQAMAAYHDDPVAWAHDCLLWKPGESLVSYQEEELAELALLHRFSARAPRGAGKTMVKAIAILWFALTREAAGEDWKVPTTAGVWRQLQKFLWPEIRKWARRLRWDKIGREPFDPRTELQTLSLKLAHGEAFALASDTPDALEGAHADQIFFVLDEAKLIPAPVWVAVEGSLSSGEAYALASSTPGEPSGVFYEIHRRAPGYEDWHVRHITLEETIAAGRIKEAWADQRRVQWGETSPIFQNQVLAQFATQAEDAVIPLAWVELANQRWLAIRDLKQNLPPLTAVGVDVARTGEDKTVLALRYRNIVTNPRRFTLADTMETTGHVRGVLERYDTGAAVVDVIGIGAGVVDRLREDPELERRVVPFNAGAAAKVGRTELRDKSGELAFSNLRAAAWWGLRERLDPSSGDDLALPPDDLLIGDLTAPKWKMTSGGRIQIESKEDMRTRIGRSTDTGDAVVQAFALEITDPEPGLAGFYRRAVEKREAEEEEDDES